MTVAFAIFKLDERRNEWSEVKDLGDLALFLGLNHSMALSTREFPELTSSSIYFTDDYIDGYEMNQQVIRDIGVFNLTDGSFQPYDFHSIDSEWNWPPQICIPPLPVAGLSDQQVIEQAKSDVLVYTTTFNPMKNPISGEEKTLMKLVVDSETDKVLGLGASMCSPDAAEIMQGIALALKCRATKAQFDSMGANTVRELAAMYWAALLPELQALTLGRLEVVDYLRFARGIATPTASSAARTRRCTKSSDGWLITVDEISELHALNSLTGSSLALPSVTTFPNVGGAVRNSDGQITDYVIVCDDLREVPYEVERMRMCYYAKAILHPSSAGSGHTVVVIYGQFNSLALAYAGDESWTQLQPPHPRTFMDIIFRKGLLHAMEYTGELMVFDLDTPGSPMVTWVAGPDSRLGCYNQKCLVKSPDGKGMFQVWRDSDWVPVDGNKQRESVFPGDARMSTEFVIFKLDERRND
uniref:Uncharacterized protein LOC105059250 n=1 Tax=Elaeis guineensis var. tenera TaxID=51953 RepID=A0A8N4F6J3_ELAGV|nr:uncharacterized protein LOC105059250 [Elaeis guineensis]